MKRLTVLLLSLLLALGLTACGGAENGSSTSLIPTPTPSATQTIGNDDPMSLPKLPAPEGYYYDLENVVLYLDAYGELPVNFITKEEARSLGWEGGSVEDYLEGAAIGGDRFYNREGLLPEDTYWECDLNTLGKDERGEERLVFTDDGHRAGF